MRDKDDIPLARTVLAVGEGSIEPALLPNGTPVILQKNVTCAPLFNLPQPPGFHATHIPKENLVPEYENSVFFRSSLIESP